MSAPTETFAFERMPPNDTAAEMCVIGGMLLSQSAIEDVAQYIKPADHYRPAHSIIHEAILELYEASEPTDAVTVADLLGRQGNLQRVGGGPHMHDCIASVPTAANAGHYAKIVREHAIRRRAIETGTRITQMAYEGAIEASDLAERAQLLADGIMPPATFGGVQDIGELFCEVVDSLESQKARGLPTPWEDVNKVIPGLAPGELIVIGASSGTGKSVAGLNLAAHAAIRRRVPAVVFTMEMTRQEVMLRLIAGEARVPLDALTHRNLNDDYWNKIEAARDRITGAPLVIDDSPAMSVATIRTRLREMARKTPAGVAFVDYLALLREPDGAENRQNAVAANARALKHLAGEFGIPIIAAAQLNRDMERRSDKRPQPSDLRDSAEIEHAASAIILLYREDVHGEETARAGEIDFIVGKNRNGPTANITLCFQGSYARCVDMSLENDRHWTPSSTLKGQR